MIRPHLVAYLAALSGLGPPAEREAVLARAAVPGGSTGNPDYSPLVAFDGVSALTTLIEESLLLSRIAGAHRLPFRVSHPFQVDPSANASWVPEGGAIPTSPFKATAVALTPRTLASLAVLSRDLLRGSHPDNRDRVLRLLASAVSARGNRTFLSDDGAVAGTSPAGLGDLAETVGAEATLPESLEAMVQAADDAGVNLSVATWILSPRRAVEAARALGTDRLGLAGGELLGAVALADRHAGDRIYLVAGDRLGWAVGGLDVDTARHAAVEMDSAPSHDATSPTAANLVSMFGSNALGFRTTLNVAWELVGSGAFVLAESES